MCLVMLLVDGRFFVNWKKLGIISYFYLQKLNVMKKAEMVLDLMFRNSLCSTIVL